VFPLLKNFPTILGNWGSNWKVKKFAQNLGNYRHVLFYVKIWQILTHPFAKRRFQSIFARGDSAVTPSKRSVNTNRKSTTRFPLSLRWIVYIDSYPFQRASKTQSVNNCFISPNSIALQAYYVTVVQDRPISSSTFGQNWLTLQRDLSATAELLVSWRLHILLITLLVFSLTVILSTLLHPSISLSQRNQCQCSIHRLFHAWLMQLTLL